MPASKAKQAEVAERRAKAIAMKLAGADWQSIADALGYASRGAAHTDVTRALEANRKAEAEQVDTLRAVETQRLDRLQAAFWPKAISERDPKAAEVILKCIAARAKLHGVEAPAKTEHSGGLRYEIIGMPEAES